MLQRALLVTGIVLFAGGLAVVVGVGPLGTMVSVPDAESPEMTPVTPMSDDPSTSTADSGGDAGTTRQPLDRNTADSSQPETVRRPPTDSTRTRSTTQSTTESQTLGSGPLIGTQTTTEGQTRTRTETPRDTQTQTQTTSSTATRTSTTETQNETATDSTATEDDPFDF